MLRDPVLRDTQDLRDAVITACVRALNRFIRIRACVTDLFVTTHE